VEILAVRAFHQLESGGSEVLFVKVGLHGLVEVGRKGEGFIFRFKVVAAGPGGCCVHCCVNWGEVGEGKAF
jgi:hypothetical protein